MNIVRRRRLRNAVRLLLVILAILCFLLVWGTLGGMEDNSIGLCQGTTQSFGGLAGTVIFSRLAGAIK